jgi:hypothetical protein
MSDGGKGSRPRPFSVSQEQFDNNFDRIFGKNKAKDVDDDVLKAYNDERLVSKFDKQSLKCWCYNCATPEYRMSHMIVCPTCGNKRCPKSTDHNLACTNSNDPGQPGSRY